MLLFLAAIIRGPVGAGGVASWNEDCLKNVGRYSHSFVKGLDIVSQKSRAVKTTLPERTQSTCPHSGTYDPDRTPSVHSHRVLIAAFWPSASRRERERRSVCPIAWPFGFDQLSAAQRTKWGFEWRPSATAHTPNSTAADFWRPVSH